MSESSPETTEALEKPQANGSEDVSFLAKETESIKVIPINLRQRKYAYHWSPRDRLLAILDRGIYNQKFAQRIGDEQFKKQYSWSPEGTLSFTRQVGNIWPKGEVVGFAIKRPKESAKINFMLGRHRIPQRKLLALIVSERRIKDDLTQYIQDIVDEQRKIPRLVPLPIYGVSGNMYWPKRMSRQEIVEELKKKGE